MNMARLAQQVQQMQQQMQVEMARVREEIDALRIETSAGGGAVKAVVNGRGEVVSLTIDREVVDPDDVEMLQDLVTAAVNDGVNRVRAEAEAKMSRVTAGMQIPGMPGLIG